MSEISVILIYWYDQESNWSIQSIRTISNPRIPYQDYKKGEKIQAKCGGKGPFNGILVDIAESKDGLRERSIFLDELIKEGLPQSHIIEKLSITSSKAPAKKTMPVMTNAESTSEAPKRSKSASAKKTMPVTKSAKPSEAPKRSKSVPNYNALRASIWDEMDWEATSLSDSIDTLLSASSSGAETPLAGSAVAPTSFRPSAVAPISSRPSAITATSSRPLAVTPTSSRPSAVTPTSSRTSAVTPTSSRTSAVTPTSSRPLAVTPTSSRLSAVTPTFSRTSAVTPTSSRPLAVTPTSPRPSAVTPTFSRTWAVTPTSSRPLAVTPTSSKPSAVTPTSSRPSAVMATASRPLASSVTPPTTYTSADHEDSDSSAFMSVSSDSDSETDDDRAMLTPPAYSCKNCNQLARKVQQLKKKLRQQHDSRILTESVSEVPVAGLMEPEKAKELGMTEVYPGTRVYWSKAQRDAVRWNCTKGETMVSRCADVFFSRDVLRVSSARGKGQFANLNDTIISACICYVQSEYNVKEAKLVKVINDKCSHVRRGRRPGMYTPQVYVRRKERTLERAEERKRRKEVKARNTLSKRLKEL